MQGEDPLLRTVECLRGRLLAERAASKAATDTADLLTTKLKELEEKLKKEQKCRRKAEKKLSILRKKLESLNIGFSICEESDECSSTSVVFTTDQGSELSSGGSMSSTSNSGFRSETGDDTQMQPRSMDCLSSCENGNAHQGVRNDSNEAEIEVGNDVQLTQNDSGLLNPSKSEEKTSKDNQKDHDDDDDEHDDSMALILSTPVESEERCCDQEIEVNNDNVREVLDTLKHIRENLKSTMERRRMIQVG